MKKKYILLNAFTQVGFNGAQIAVFSQADDLTSQQMLSLAKELNLTETVFISQSSLSDCDAKLQIFTPRGLSGFAGHAVVAACYVLADVGMVQGANAKIELNGKQLDVVLNLKNQKVQISLPLDEKYDEYVPSNQALAQIAGINEDDIGYLSYKPMITGCPDTCLMIPVKNNAVLRSARFNENKWQLSFVAPLAQHILLFSGEHDYQNINFVARLIGKEIAEHEDPPVGTVAPAFGLYLAHNINDYHRSCLIQRGSADSRISIMEVSVDKDGSQVAELQLGGHVVKMAEGYFDLPD